MRDLEHASTKLNHARRSSYCWSMISGQTLRVCSEIMLQPRECPGRMPIPVPHTASGAWRLGSLASAPIALIAIALCGCSINLGSLSPEPDNHVPPAAAPATGTITPADLSSSQAATARGQVLARSGKTEEAVAEFDQALAFDPNNAEALYSRGLLYQDKRQHQAAIDDFTAANGLTPQRAEPLLGRAISYLALDKVKEAIADLDEAAEADPQNAQIWTTRGLAYERVGDKTKAATCFARAVALRPRDEAAKGGLARVGG
jgi:tetratricopeptide (TPR) repeat protein